MQRFSLLLFLLLHLVTSAQSYIGFDADNFNGIHGVLFNPANIADSRLKLDINLASASVFTVNNYTELDYWKLFTDSDFDMDRDAKTVGINKKVNGVVNVDALGPSALITLNPKRAVGFTTRVRSLLNANTIDGVIIDFFDVGISENTPFRKSDINGNASLNNFVEFGISYAQVFKQDRVEFFKAGISLKYLRGINSATAQVDNGTAFNNPTVPEVFLNGTGSLSLSNNLANIDEVAEGGENDNGLFSEGANGFGIDLGFVYEYRPNPRANVSRDHVKDQKRIRNKTIYKYKIGVSILDLGFLNYRNQEITNLRFSTITEQELVDIDSLEDIEALFGNGIETNNLRLGLPTRLRAEFDLKILNKLFLNTASTISLVSAENNNTNRYASQITLSPRYETQWFTAFMPITATRYGGLQVGLGGRLGPFFLGASGLFSRTFDNQTRAFDMYAGVKVPIFHRSPSSRKNRNSAETLNCIENGKNTPIKAKRLKSYEGQFHKK